MLPVKSAIALCNSLKLSEIESKSSWKSREFTVARIFSIRSVLYDKLLFNAEELSITRWTKFASSALKPAKSESVTIFSKAFSRFLNLSEIIPVLCTEVSETTVFSVSIRFWKYDILSSSLSNEILAGIEFTSEESAWICAFKSLTFSVVSVCFTKEESSANEFSIFLKDCSALEFIEEIFKEKSLIKEASSSLLKVFSFILASLSSKSCKTFFWLLTSEEKLSKFALNIWNKSFNSEFFTSSSWEIKSFWNAFSKLLNFWIAVLCLSSTAFLSSEIYNLIKSVASLSSDIISSFVLIPVKTFSKFSTLCSFSTRIVLRISAISSTVSAICFSFLKISLFTYIY